MGRKTTTRMLGCADYEARWIDDSMTVQLTAKGFLPCSNHHAQMEKRADGGWEMVFYTQETCDETYTPFAVQAIAIAENSQDRITISDALGTHGVAIQPAEVKPEDTGDFFVYARKTTVKVPDETYFILPAGTRVLPIYRRAFGPASKADCRAFIASANNRFMMELDELHAKIARVEVGED